MHLLDHLKGSGALTYILQRASFPRKSVRHQQLVVLRWPHRRVWYPRPKDLLISRLCHSLLKVSMLLRVLWVMVRLRRPPVHLCSTVRRPVSHLYHRLVARTVLLLQQVSMGPHRSNTNTNCLRLVLIIPHLDSSNLRLLYKDLRLKLDLHPLRLEALHAQHRELLRR